MARRARSPIDFDTLNSRVIGDEVWIWNYETALRAAMMAIAALGYQLRDKRYDAMVANARRIGNWASFARALDRYTASPETLARPRFVLVPSQSLSV